MRVLVDIVHPADVLFFLRPIRILTARGDEVFIVSREKDVTIELLDSLDLLHLPISRSASGVVSLGFELFRRDMALWKIARRFRPDVMIGFGGIAISHVGKLTGIPSISFYDSENARLQTLITWPFITKLFVPDSYTGQVPEKRTVRISGTKDLSYFHPSYFTASREIALRNGLDPQRDNFFLRIVSWRAGHDIGKTGWSEELLLNLVKRLEPHGRVHILSEVPLRSSLKKYAYMGKSREVHHLMAYCRIYVGESATMACESAILGTLAIYNGHDSPGYLLALERAGLVSIVPAGAVNNLLRVLDEALSRPAKNFEAKRENWLKGCPDWARVVIAAVDDYANLPTNAAAQK
jgi:predicted glycosyltransferase